MCGSRWYVRFTDLPFWCFISNKKSKLGHTNHPIIDWPAFHQTIHCLFGQCKISEKLSIPLEDISSPSSYWYGVVYNGIAKIRMIRSFTMVVLMDICALLLLKYFCLYRREELKSKRWSNDFIYVATSSIHMLNAENLWNSLRKFHAESR